MSYEQSTILSIPLSNGDYLSVNVDYTYTKGVPASGNDPAEDDSVDVTKVTSKGRNIISILKANVVDNLEFEILELL